VLIHGLWLTPRSWNGWIDRYEKAGYKVLAPLWHCHTNYEEWSDREPG